jgi:metallo-beta-lactamase class B
LRGPSSFAKGATDGDQHNVINGHGHSDHAGTFAFFKKLTGAQIAIMETDVARIGDGGKSDFHYGHDWQI